MKYKLILSTIVEVTCPIHNSAYNEEDFVVLAETNSVSFVYKFIEAYLLPSKF